MMHEPQSETAQLHWSSRFAFIMAASGFAVGLGNIWRFPYLAGENGGSAFVLVYLACAFGIGAPLIMAELMIGRRGGADVLTSIRNVAREAGASPRWSGFGVLALCASFVILAYYVVIAGWTVDYILQALLGTMSGQQIGQSQAAHDSLMASPVRMAFWSACVVALTAFIVGKGIQKGIEKSARILMPLLFLGLVALAGYAALVGDMNQAIAFLLTPDFSKINGHAVLAAVGQAFFSVGVGFGTMISFGSYLSPKTSLSGSAATIVGADTMVALIAGLAIFPFVFGFGLEPSSGPGLVFITLPVAFGTLTAGSLIAAFFFLLLFVAAITSCVGLFEPLISWAVAHRGMARGRAILIGAGLIWLVSFATIFSFNLLADFHPLAAIETFAQSTVYALQDYFSANVMLPLGALLTAIFAGWVVPRLVWSDLLASEGEATVRIWSVAVRFLVPAALIAIFLGAVTA